MTCECTICKEEICDTFHWIVDGKDWNDIWCAKCHYTHREGERDIPVWEEDKYNNEEETDDS